MALGKNLKKKSITDKPEKATIGPKGNPSKDGPVAKDGVDQPKSTSLENIKKGNKPRSKFKKGGKQLQESASEETRELTVVVFPVGNEEYAMRIDQIKEIVDLPPIARIPQAASHTLGLTNIRGEIYGVWDLSILFGLVDSARSEEEDRKYAIVIQLEEFYVALTVRTMPETLTVSESAIEESTHILKHANRHDEYIKGVIRKDQRLIILMDVLDVIKSTYEVQEI